MAEIKNKKTEAKKSTAQKKNSKTKVKQSPEPENKKDDFLTEAAKTIESGVDVAGEKISELADKTVETAGELFKAVKKGLSSTYDASAKVIDDISNTAQDYIDKYKKNLEVNKLSEKRDELTKKLGTLFFAEFKVKKEDTVPSFFKKEEILNLIDEIEKLNKNIVKIGKKLENK